jgi:hypothetical protein
MCHISKHVQAELKESCMKLELLYTATLPKFKAKARLHTAQGTHDKNP